MLTVPLRISLAYNLDEIRSFPQGSVRNFEVIELPARHRWLFVPHSLDPDDGINWLLPTWQDPVVRGRWGRWQMDSGGGEAIGLPIDISDVSGLQAELDAINTELDGVATLPIAQADVTGLVAALAAKQATSEKGAASGYASLNGGTKVVEDPANATATPTASKIVIADGSGLVDGWVSDADASTKGKVKLANDLGGTAALPKVVAITETSGPTQLVVGAIADGEYAKRVGGTLVGGTPSGMSAADVLLQKQFFVDRSLMPATTFHEDLYLYPARDFSNLNGGSLTVNRSRAKYASAAIANWGWDIGSAKTKILFITYMNVANGASDLSIFVADTTPTASEVANGTYMLNISGTTTAIFKRASGSFTSLGSDTHSGIQANSSSSMEVGVALYYDDSTGTLIAFLRKSGQWMPIVDITDSSFTTMRYVGYRVGGGTPIHWVNTVAIYYTT